MKNVSGVELAAAALPLDGIGGTSCSGPGDEPAAADRVGRRPLGRARVPPALPSPGLRAESSAPLTSSSDAATPGAAAALVSIADAGAVLGRPASLRHLAAELGSPLCAQLPAQRPVPSPLSHR